MTKPAKTYRVDLQPVPGMTEDEGLRALRAFLKASLRSFGLRCVAAVEVQAAPKPITEGVAYRRALDEGKR